MIRIVLVIAGIALMTPSLSGQSIKTHTEKNVDLTDYETFRVAKGEFVTPPDSRKMSEESLYQSIKAAVKREMEDRGYKLVEDSSAQLVISYVAGSYNLTDAGVTGPLGQAPASTPADLNQSRSWSHTSREGMLVLDIIDAANKKALWKAEAEDLPIENVDFKRALDATIFKAYKKFPNKNKKKKK